MSSVGLGGSCRVTVVGPAGQADLAVPLGLPLADLLPALARFVSNGGSSTSGRGDGVAMASEDASGRPGAAVDGTGAWSLQRLGAAPMDPNRTPAELGWLDGEQLHLVPADDPMPELDFDDVADGIATIVERQPDRWGAVEQRRTFTALAVVAAVAAAVLALRGADPGVAVLELAALGVLAATGAVLLARRDQPVLSCWCVLTAALDAWLLAVAAADGLRDSALLPGGLVAAALAGLLLVSRRLLAPQLPIVPLGAVLTSASAALVASWVRALGATQPGAAVLVADLLVVLLLTGPRLAVRLARIRAPQLPRSGRELRIDAEPLSAEALTRRTVLATSALTASVLGFAAALVAAQIAIGRAPGWAAHTTVPVLAGLLLLRARELGATPSRLALCVAGATGMVVALFAWAPTWSGAMTATALAVTVVIAVALLLTALRPLHRRLLPRWRHTANLVELLLGAALLPLTLQLLDVFAWARGLGG